MPGSQRKIQRGLHHSLEPKSGVGGFLHLPHNRSVLLFLMASVSSLEMACGSAALCTFSDEFQNTAPQAFDQIMLLVVQYQSPGLILSRHGTFDKTWDIFDCHKLEEGAPHIQWAEAREAAQHPAMHSTAPTAKKDVA